MPNLQKDCNTGEQNPLDHTGSFNLGCEHNGYFHVSG